MTRECSSTVQESSTDSSSSERPTDFWATNVWGGLPQIDNPTVHGHASPAIQSLPVTPRIQVVQTGDIQSLPNPCVDENFQTPVYEVDWNLTRTHLNDSGEYPIRLEGSATLRDTANNYSMVCKGSPVVVNRPWKWWSFPCVFEDGVYDGNTQHVSSVSIYPNSFANPSVTSWWTVQQYWVCSGRDSKAYPYVQAPSKHQPSY